MPRPFNLTWRGASVFDHVNRATVAGMDETMSECVVEAKRNAPVDTGALQADIDYRPARIVGSRITGRWGNWLIPYAIFQEFGTFSQPARYYLRRAREAKYHHLAARIKAHM